MTAEDTEKNPFLKWLEEVSNDPLTVIASEEGLLSECRQNMWTFSLSQSQAEVTTVEDVLSFLSGVMQARERQINVRSGPINPMVFYCWFDEQASQLRFSLVSSSHDCLLFGAVLKETDNFAEVVKLFLSSRYHNSIPLEEFRIVEKFDELSLPEPLPYVLLVATRMLPSN